MVTASQQSHWHESFLTFEKLFASHIEMRRLDRFLRDIFEERCFFLLSGTMLTALNWMMKSLLHEPSVCFLFVLFVLFLWMVHSNRYIQIVRLAFLAVSREYILKQILFNNETLWAALECHRLLILFCSNICVCMCVDGHEKKIFVDSSSWFQFVRCCRRCCCFSCWF